VIPSIIAGTNHVSVSTVVNEGGWWRRWQRRRRRRLAADVSVDGRPLAGYGMGDHRLFVINFAANNIIGNTAPKVMCAAS
jgi:hypothetical protein